MGRPAPRPPPSAWWASHWNERSSPQSLQLGSALRPSSAANTATQVGRRRGAGHQEACPCSADRTSRTVRASTAMNVGKRHLAAERAATRLDGADRLLRSQLDAKTSAGSRVGGVQESLTGPEVSCCDDGPLPTARPLCHFGFQLDGDCKARHTAMMQQCTGCFTRPAPDHRRHPAAG